MYKQFFLIGPVGFLTLLLTVFFGEPAQAQFVNRVVPTPHYFAASLNDYNRGEFARAMAAFNEDLRHMVKIPDANGVMTPWVDAMCYTIMVGECHYQLGRYAEAMTAFNNAAQMFVANQNWLANITFVNTPVMVPRLERPWGKSQRPGGVGNFRNCKFQILQSNLNLIDLGRQGTGLMQQQQLTTIHADEIIIRLALLIRRRAEILGPLSKYDPITKNMTEIMGGRPCPANHFSGVWIDVLYGMLLAAMGDDTAAKPELEKGRLMQRQFDHQLTPYALNELADIELRNGNPQKALEGYFEASLSAADFNDWALLGETFRSMANAQRLLDRNKMLPALEPMLAHLNAIKDPSPLVVAPVCHEIAEAALMAGRLKPAVDLLNTAGGTMARRSIADGIHGARNNYLRAMASYMGAFMEAKGGRALNLKPADDYLAAALLFMRRGSLWLYQLGVLEQEFQQGRITARGPINMRVADELYEFLLRDPTLADWTIRPMDSLTQMTFTPPTAYERWFYVALQRNNREKAFEISELARRARFFSSFRLGPRLFALRILFEGDTEDINQQMLLQRQSLSLDFTRFGELSSKVDAVKKQLLMLPIVPSEQNQIEQQKKLLEELDQLSLQQEAMLRPIALTRNQAPIAFPPIMKLDQIRAELPENTSMLVYFEAMGNCYGFLIDRRNLTMWPLIQGPREPSLSRLITDFLEGMGNRNANQAIPIKDIANPDAKWKKAGFDLLKRLLGEERKVNFTELVVVPTGPIWYVPFEALTVKINDEYRPLISAGSDPLSIRYAPMASLGVPRKATRSPVAQTLVLHGKMMPRDDARLTLDAIDRFTKLGIRNLVPMATLSNDPHYREFSGTSSTFATQIRQLIVLEDTPGPKPGEPLGWTPFSAERQKNPISSWLVLPWGGPQLIILPGFHTTAEAGAKATSGSASRTINNGDDLFLSAMALQACGARTILISRWRTGGRASFDLVGEFLENYQTMPAAEAWRRAVIDVGGTPLTLAEEPRVRSTASDEAPLANHPFFWGAFLLIDRGEMPETEEGQPEKSKLD